MIGVIITTVGRESLFETLDSCLEADEIVVIADGPNVPYLNVEEDADYVVPDRSYGCHGHPLRNYLLDRPSLISDWIVSIDDDDEFLPGAFAAIQHSIDTISDARWFVFKMRFGPGSHCPGVTVWHDKTLRMGNIGTPMIVAPASAKARWGTRGIDDLGRDLGDGYFGDHDYARALQEELGDPIWVDEVIAEIRPIAA